MSKPKEPVQAKLIASLITENIAVLKSSLAVLYGTLGNMDFISEKIKFNHTQYYEKEMGKDLFRKIISFENLILPDELSSIKVFTNSIEDRHTENGRRKINIDPGYIVMEKMILATCKNFSHRIYLSKGVYADLTLIYRGNNFVALEWTFPDYADTDMRNLLKGIRQRYVLQLEKIREQAQNIE